jgi:hypothetical protein
VRSGLFSMLLLSLATTAAAPQTNLDELIARAKSLELNTPYVPPPGDPLAHHAAGYAKVLCTAVLVLRQILLLRMSDISLLHMPCGRNSVSL